MNRMQPKEYFSRDHRAVQHNAIEWEELPSLADLLCAPALGAAARAEPHVTPAWRDTMPARLESLPQSEPFRETLRGLSTREVREPEVFRLFFGSPPA